MGKTREKNRSKPPFSSFPSPSSSSSSDFEFTVSLSPTSRRSPTHLCPADELFYKGQLLPLHLSPRISMVRTLLLASSSTSSSSDTTTTASRDSNGSSSSSSSSFSADLLLLPECDSSRPSSVTEEDTKKILPPKRPSGKYFSSFATRFSSVFRVKKDPSSAAEIKIQIPTSKRTANPSSSSSSSAKEVIKKYVRKVKPLYEKLSSLQHKQSNTQHQYQQKKTFSFSIKRERDAGSCKKDEDQSHMGMYSHSFSGNLRYPRRKRCAGSCPSSMRSSPTHSGLLSASGGGGGGGGAFPEAPAVLSSSSMEELQSAIQGAIAHCKSSMVQSNQKKKGLLVDEICGL